MDFLTTEYPPEALDLLERLCPQCLRVLRVGDFPFCPHEPLGDFSVRPDSVPGGFVIENMSAEPMRFDSKSEWRAEMKRRGLVQKVEHKPLPGTDKSDKTQRFI